MDNFLLVVAALLLVLLNGFFVAAEFGLVKLRQTRVRSIAKVSGLRGRLLTEVHQHLDTYLSACQLGITLASLGLGWIGEPAFASILKPVFPLIGVSSAEIIHGVSFFFAFFVISFLHIVIGELAPKSMAIRMPERVSLWTAPALYGFYWLMFPAIWLLNASSNKVLKWVGLDGTHGNENAYSHEELKLILRGSHGSGKESGDEWGIMAQVLDFGGLEISDLMRPINEVAAMYKDRSLEENMATAARNRFSRYPYFDEDEKTVLGMLHLKDLFLAQQAGKHLDDLSHHLRQVEYVPPTMPALELFRRFRKGAPHFAIVGHKGSKPLGFLTLDNLLGALIGQIRDEFRQNENDWTLLDDGTLIGKGSLPLYTLGMALGFDLDNDEVESIGGLIMQQLGDLPSEGQKVAFDQFDVVVKKMNGPRIVLVRVYPKKH
ncbi:MULTISPECIES: hemolysin family protein [unclassified Undibacterium]|uniref:hemolysin family protein n=1 Tax=unclassified Undibacterium TaxID=2630295 RepID=UPI002AC95E08|nr:MULTISPECIES: hemolysin family protein [unclassified Undibacterium]MEB0137445.1 hemolysin family protein [Undibacterium sp. CCC2.1]MEB0170890.1 hemolysin family protein [Undibacterium sp. CCC1.1]MEB0174842.1 hemolysin family protein [Undibacterium sp. CCC3.4]MEB0214178.1 hemolysin family protein [Undibacterium sp. 5I2]WPX45591.1 hemolysin family protein [Undibacterium sp. CCC3.4]